MTIDEAIRHAEEKATEQRATADYYRLNGIIEDAINECEKCRVDIISFSQ